MGFKLIKAGLQTSIQDLGRFGQMHNGVSRSGAMDPIAMQMANWLVSRPLNSPVLEICLTGPCIQFEKEMSIAICGAYFDLQLNGNKIFNNQLIRVSKDDILTFNRLKKGARAYLSFSGEMTLNKILSSYSTHLTAQFGGYYGRQFGDNEHLEITSITHPEYKELPEFARINYTNNYLLRCTPGIESQYFNSQQITQFYSQKFFVSSKSNRMGLRLTGKPLLMSNNLQITSSGLTAGSIQIPASGEPIITSVDGQTIGGYPRIANIISADLPLLGQLQFNNKVSFSQISESDAQKILKEKRARLRFLFDS